MTKQSYTKANLIDDLAAMTGESKAAIKRVLDSTLHIIPERVRQGLRVELREFAVFEAKDTKERQGRNPRTGEPITIPAGKRPVVRIKFSVE